MSGTPGVLAVYLSSSLWSRTTAAGFIYLTHKTGPTDWAIDIELMGVVSCGTGTIRRHSPCWRDSNGPCRTSSCRFGTPAVPLSTKSNEVFMANTWRSFSDGFRQDRRYKTGGSRTPAQQRADNRRKGR